MTDLKKSLVTVLSQPFDLVMISIDHPNPKCLKLPAILGQTVRVPVILFAEGSSQATINLLRMSKHPYILYPPVGGPAIERMLQKIAKDKLGNKDLYGSRQNSDDLISISNKSFSMEDVVRLFEGDGSLSGHTDQSLSVHSRGAPVAEGTGVARGGTVVMPESKLYGTSLRLESSLQSVLIMSAEHALEQVGGKDLSALSQTLIPIRRSKISCFEMRCKHFTGYLVVSFGGASDRNLDLNEEFNETLKVHLLKYLEENGISATGDDFLDLELTEVSFEQWSLQEAAFLRKAVCSGGEIALAFFPHDAKHLQLEVSVQSHMYKLNIEDLKVGAVLEFDVYIYLPKNRRYVRVASKKRVFGQPQKARLVSKGTEVIHVLKDAEKDIIRYRIQNFLNDKIDSFLSLSA